MEELHAWKRSRDDGRRAVGRRTMIPTHVRSLVARQALSHAKAKKGTETLGRREIFPCKSHDTLPESAASIVAVTRLHP